MDSNEKISFDVKLSPKDVFKFNMYHNYRRVQPYIYLVLGVAVMVIAIINAGKFDTTSTLLYILLGFMLAAYNPLSFFVTSKFQASEAGPLGKSMRYVFDDMGITVSFTDDEEKATAGEGVDSGNIDSLRSKISYNEIYKVKESGSAIYIYTSNRNASILPKDKIGSNLDAVRERLKLK